MPVSCPLLHLPPSLTFLTPNLLNLSLTLTLDMLPRGWNIKSLHLQIIQPSTILNNIICRCYSKERAGFKYYSSVVRDVASVSSLSGCASRCGREVFCNSFSFRFSSLNDQDNCLLSGLNTSDIYPSSDLVQDRDWDIWQHKCKPGSNNVWTLRTEASKLSSQV